jgi:hypothetical protein
MAEWLGRWAQKVYASLGVQTPTPEQGPLLEYLLLLNS